MSHPKETHPFTTSMDNKEYADLINELNNQVAEQQPEDLLQFCTTFFLTKLEEERAESRQYEQHPLSTHQGSFGSDHLGPDFHPGHNTLDQHMHSDNDNNDDDDDDEDEERDAFPEEPMTFSAPPTNRGRRTSVSAESMQPSHNTQDFIKVVHPKGKEDMDSIEASLKNNFMFRNLDEEQYRDVVNAMEIRKVEAGTRVIEQGGVGDYFYSVGSGELDCLVNDNKVTSYTSGGSFGELALMYNAPRAATIVARTDCVLYALDRVTFRMILMENTSSKRKMYESFLKEVPIFKSLEVYERHKIADALESVLFENGKEVICEGDVGDNFYLIESGEAHVYKRLPDGTQQEVMVGNKGDYFGELALLNDEPRAATVIAQGNLKCATLGKKAFTRLLGPVMDILKRNSENYHAVLKQANQ